MTDCSHPAATCLTGGRTSCTGAARRARLGCVCLSGGGRTCGSLLLSSLAKHAPLWGGGEGRPTQKELKRRRCHMTEVLFHCSSHFRERRPSDGFPLRLADFGGKLYNSEVFRSALNVNFGARAIDIFFSLSLLLSLIPQFHKSLRTAADVIAHQLLNLLLL